MKNLTDREQNMVLATIRLWNVNAKRGFVPDYELMQFVEDLPMETLRDIRDLVQEAHPCRLPVTKGTPDKPLCPFCGSDNISTKYDVGYDIDPEGEERQHIDYCECGAWRFRTDRLHNFMTPETFLGKWHWRRQRKRRL